MARKSTRKKNSPESRSELQNQPSDLTVKSYINWFPGHMRKAIRQVKEKLSMVDIVLEIRDARAPLVSGNLTLQKELGQKRRLIVLNKVNLASTRCVKEWDRWFKKRGEQYVFINSFSKKSLKMLVTESQKMMKTKWESFEKKGLRHPPLRLMILGVPNTGKSTIINRLTRRKAARTGDRPGVTQGQQWIVLNEDVELLDTPGIMPPKIENEEQGFWLCAIHAIRDEIVGKEKVAYFIIEHLVKHRSEELKNKYQLVYENLTTEDLLEQIGLRLNCIKNEGVVDLAKTSNKILLDFRKGELGNTSFEYPPQD